MWLEDEARRPDSGIRRPRHRGRQADSPASRQRQQTADSSQRVEVEVGAVTDPDRDRGCRDKQMDKWERRARRRGTRGGPAMPMVSYPV